MTFLCYNCFFENEYMRIVNNFKCNPLPIPCLMASLPPLRADATACQFWHRLETMSVKWLVSLIPPTCLGNPKQFQEKIFSWRVGGNEIIAMVVNFYWAEIVFQASFQELCLRDLVIFEMSYRGGYCCDLGWRCPDGGSENGSVLLRPN